jgi:hypothetical protein
MTTRSTTSPVTRETSAFVRDRGARALIVTIAGGLLELRPKGLRTREVVDIAAIYEMAVKARVLGAKNAKAKARAEKVKARAARAAARRATMRRVA